MRKFAIFGLVLFALIGTVCLIAFEREMWNIGVLAFISLLLIVAVILLVCARSLLMEIRTSTRLVLTEINSGVLETDRTLENVSSSLGETTARLDKLLNRENAVDLELVTVKLANLDEKLKLLSGVEARFSEETQHLFADFSESLQTELKAMSQALRAFSGLEARLSEEQQQLFADFSGSLQTDLQVMDKSFKVALRDSERRISNSMPKAKETLRLRERAQAAERRILGSIEDYNLTSNGVLTKQLGMLHALAEQVNAATRSNELVEQRINDSE